MFLITLTEKNGGASDVRLMKKELTVGRLAANDLVLSKGNVSKYHTRIVYREGKVVIVDMKSTNGTYVNGRKILGPQVIKPHDKVSIGDYVLNIQPAEDPEESTAEPTYPIPRQQLPAPLWEAARPAPEPPRLDVLRKDVHDRLMHALDLRRLDLDRLGDAELRRKTEKAVRDLIVQMQAQAELPETVDVETLVKEVLDEALGLGPLEELLADETVTEVMVNHASQIYVERDGKMVLTEKTFSSDRAVLAAIERIVAPVGRRIDESSPLVDARLKDGSRVNAVIPPLALKGPCLTIRKFRRDALEMKDLLRHQTLSPAMAAFLRFCVEARRNIVIAGGTGSGKTTTLNILSRFIPENDRIITLEDAAELQLPQPHWVQLEARPPNLEGKGSIPIRELVRNALRMRPDRLIVGECRGGEALDMLQAMNTGHEGSLTTLHANSPRDALSRLETLVMMAGMDLPVRAIRDQVASAVHILIQQTRFADGSRKITHISEVTGMEGDVITLQELFHFVPDGTAADGKVRGRYVATGFIPKFYDELRRQGAAVDSSIFQEE